MGKEKPILFQGAMVRAILDGRKTQTRRLMKPQPSKNTECLYCLLDSTCSETRRHIGSLHDGESGEFFRPRCEPGDVLWVRESVKGIAVESMDGVDGVKYLADGEEKWWDCLGDNEDQWFKLCNYGKGAGPNTVPSIHMPRWASRLSLPVVSVRAERLQEITEEDARAEGVKCATGGGPGGILGYKFEGTKDWEETAREAFADYWDTLSKPGSKWDDNPWVWVIEFEVEK